MNPHLNSAPLAPLDVTRRSFLQKAMLVAGVSGLPLFAMGGESAAPAGKGFAESARNLTVHEDADVIVCGAGPAGVAAALSAARTGARVRLMEVHGCLGGVWTAGLLSWIFDFDKPGLTRELVRKLDERGARRGTDKK